MQFGLKFEITIDAGLLEVMHLRLKKGLVWNICIDEWRPRKKHWLSETRGAKPNADSWVVAEAASTTMILTWKMALSSCIQHWLAHVLSPYVLSRTWADSCRNLQTQLF